MYTLILLIPECLSDVPFRISFHSCNMTGLTSDYILFLVYYANAKKTILFNTTNNKTVPIRRTVCHTDNTL